MWYWLWFNIFWGKIVKWKGSCGDDIKKYNVVNILRKTRKVDKLIWITHHALDRIKEYWIEWDIALKVYDYICKISNDIYKHRISCRHCIIMNGYKYIFNAEDWHITVITVIPNILKPRRRWCWNVVNECERRVILDFILKHNH
jgi:hypothetical protein